MVANAQDLKSDNLHYNAGLSLETLQFVYLLGSSDITDQHIVYFLIYFIFYLKEGGKFEI